jgi:hypothetical protein
MKKNIVILLLGLGIAGHADQKFRTFTSVDGEKTFEGRLTAFDENSSTVTVLNSRRQQISFNIDRISEEDREYVVANASKLAPSANLKIRFEPLRERTGKASSGDSRSTTHDGGYTIYVNSYSPERVADARVEYVMIYRKDQLEGKHSDQVIKGHEIVNITTNGSAAVQTETVQLVNQFKAGQVSSSGGGCSGGSCGKGSVTATRSKRSRDLLIGCVARVIVNGEIVSENATSPDLLRKYESELGGKY